MAIFFFNLFFYINIFYFNTFEQPEGPQVARANQGTVQYKTQYIKKSNMQSASIYQKINMHIKLVINVCHKIPRKSIWGGYMQQYLYPTISPCVDPRPKPLSIFHGNLPQKICGATSLMFIMGNLFSLIGNQRVGIFPSKSEILFFLSLALIWCQNCQVRAIPVGGDTWPSCSAERRKRIIT